MKTTLAAATCPACAALRDVITLKLADLGMDAGRIAWTIGGTTAEAVAARVKKMRQERAAQ